MNTNQNPSQNQLQQLALTPEMRESLRILQMPVTELEAYISLQIMENCVLEMREPGGENEGVAHLDQADANDPLPENPELIKQNYSAITAEEFPNDAEKTAIEEIRPNSGELPDYSWNESTSLQEHLLFQLHITNLPLVQQRIGEFLIGNIDEDGYLRCQPPEAAALLFVTPAQVSKLIQLIQSFDPPGVGCRNLAECLFLQWKADRNRWEKAVGPEIYAVVAQIILKYLPEVANGKFGQIATKIKKPLSDVQKATELIKRLNPKPGRNFGFYNNTLYIVPDVIVTKHGAIYHIAVADSVSTLLHVNPYYHRILNSATIDQETAQYIKLKLHAALFLIKCLEQRKNTLTKIAVAIVNQEKQFLDDGPLYLIPLTLQDIAAAVGLHESTISRAIQGKYIETPQGTFPLKYFFHRRMNTSQGNAISSESIKRIITDFIRSENKRIPYSDQQLSMLLKDRGIIASRRTVTKYREELAIPTSVQRKGTYL